MSDSTENKSGASGWVVFGLFALIYLSTLSANLGVTHDSIAYAAQILGDEFLFYPNHLLYQPLLALFVQAAGGLGLAADITTIAVFGAVAGAATLAVSYRILREGYAVSAPIAWAAVLCAGFSYGLWYYSVGIEIYIFPLFCLVACFYVLAVRAKTIGWIMVAAILHSVALLLHQTSILFALVPILALLRSDSLSVSTGIRFLALYIGLGTVIVIGTYLAVAAHLGHLSSVDAFIGWFLGYGTEATYWSPLGPVALLLAAVGWGRAVIGGHFAFGSPTIRPILEGLFPGNSLVDEAFLVRGYPGWVIDGLFGLAVLCGVFVAVLLFLALRNIGRREKRDSTRLTLTLLAAWLIPFILFFIFWNAQNADFWITQTLLLWLIIAVLLDRVRKPRWMAGLFAAIAACLFILNGVGTVLPAANPANDYYAVRVNQLAGEARPAGLIVIADRWPEGAYIEFLTDHDFVGLAKNAAKTSPVEAAAAIRQQAAGRPIYLWPDIASVKRETKIAYGASIEIYVRDVLTALCSAGREENATPDAIQGLGCNP